MHNKPYLLKNMIIKRFTGSHFEENKCILTSQSRLDTLPGTSQEGASVSHRHLLLRLQPEGCRAICSLHVSLPLADSTGSSCTKTRRNKCLFTVLSYGNYKIGEVCPPSRHPSGC